MNWLHEPVAPMLATLVDDIPEGDYNYEVKWDGIRAIITVNQGDIRIRSRNQNDITNRFPELQNLKAFPVGDGVFDGEIVCMDQQGKPSFKRIIKRLKTSNNLKIQGLVKTHPVQCYIFDCLYLNGRPLIKEPLDYRYAQVAKYMNEGAAYRISETVEDGKALFQAIREHDMEGIMAKKKTSLYYPGKRSDHWQKIKIRKTAYCLIIGYTKGKGDRSNYFGALHVAELTGQGPAYRGKVGTGYTIKSMKEIHSQVKTLEEVAKPDYAPSSNSTTWINPQLIAEISYSSLTPDDVFRDPVFHRLRPDRYSEIT